MNKYDMKQKTHDQCNKKYINKILILEKTPKN